MPLPAGIISRVARRVAPKLFQAARRAGPLESAIIPARRLLVARGGPVGEALSNGLVRARDIAERAHGRYLVDMRRVIDTLTPEENTLLARGLLGQPTAGRPQAVIEGLRPLFDASGKTPQSVIQEIVAGGTPIPAKIQQDGRRLLDLVFTKHSDDLARALVRRDVLPLVQRLKEPGLKDIAQRTVNNVLSQVGGGGTLATLRSFNTATLLGRAVILNASQPALSVISSGIRPFIQTVEQIATRRGREEAGEFATRIGVALDGAISDYIRYDLAPGKLQRLGTKVLRGTGFLAVERFNRRLAASIARQWFADLERKAKLGDVLALRQLKRFNVDPTKATRGRLDVNDLENFARAFVRETQFRLTPEELPLMSNSEWWRTFFQFRTFGLKAAELLLNEAETRGILKTAARAIPITAAVGAPIAAIRRLTAGRPPISRHDTPLDLAAETVLSVGIGGLLFDAIEAIRFRRLPSFIGGPTVGLAEDVGKAALGLGRGDIRPLITEAAGRVPAVGPLLRRQVRSALRTPRGNRGPRRPTRRSIRR